ncbi:hypothetical protein V6N13_114597 [Hibiscus sabdariffa]
MLMSWFDDIDSKGSFKAKFKLKIWVNLENLSIVAWNNELFIAIVSRWGKVIKIEEDTSFRNQFDCARILNGVKSISDEATRVVPNTTTNTACLEGGVPGEMKHCDRPNPKLGAGQVGLREVESDPNNQSKEFQNRSVCLVDVPTRSNSRAFMWVSDNILEYGPKMDKASGLFQETKLQKVEEALFKKLNGGSLNLRGKFSPSIVSARCFIALWNPNFFEAESCLIEVNFIALLGKITTLNIQCLLVNVYAPNEYHKRQELFSKIFDLVSKCARHVILGGDFNVVRDQEEKLGKSSHKIAMKDFFDFIEELNLFYLYIHGSKFTCRI